MPKRLLVCLDNLGDLVWAGALLRELKALDPKGTVGLWAKSYSAGLAPFLPNLDRFHASDPFWEPSPGAKPGSLSDFYSTIRDIREEGYDDGIIVNTRWKVCAAAKAAGIRNLIGFAQRASTPWLSAAAESESRGREALMEWSRLLIPLGFNPKPLIPELFVPKRLEPRRALILETAGEKTIAVCHPAAGDPRRCAPAAFWVELSLALESLGYRVAWTGRTDELRPLRETLGDLGRDHLWGDAFSAGQLEDSLLLISAAGLFIGHDSGPLHAAAAFGVPSLGLYLPGDWPRARPISKAPLKIIRRRLPNDLRLEQVMNIVRSLARPKEALR